VPSAFAVLRRDVTGLYHAVAALWRDRAASCGACRPIRV